MIYIYLVMRLLLNVKLDKDDFPAGRIIVFPAQPLPRVEFGGIHVMFYELFTI